jgi:hypothetical protein
MLWHTPTSHWWNIISACLTLYSELLQFDNHTLIDNLGDVQSTIVNTYIILPLLLSSVVGRCKLLSLARWCGLYCCQPVLLTSFWHSVYPSLLCSSSRSVSRVFGIIGSRCTKKSVYPSLLGSSSCFVSRVFGIIGSHCWLVWWHPDKVSKPFHSLMFHILHAWYAIVNGFPNVTIGHIYCLPPQIPWDEINCSTLFNILKILGSLLMPFTNARYNYVLWFQSIDWQSQHNDCSAELFL